MGVIRETLARTVSTPLAEPTAAVGYHDTLDASVHDSILAEHLEDQRRQLDIDDDSVRCTIAQPMEISDTQNGMDLPTQHEQCNTALDASTLEFLVEVARELKFNPAEHAETTSTTDNALHVASGVTSSKSTSLAGTCENASTERSEDETSGSSVRRASNGDVHEDDCESTDDMDDETHGIVVGRSPSAPSCLNPSTDIQDAPSRSVDAS